MRRRALLQLAAAMLAGPVGLYAQARTFRLAWLGGSSAAASAHLEKATFGRLEELGYREGRSLLVDRRYAEGNFDRLPALAAELVALRPDVVLTLTTPPTLAALKATRTIPIVFVAVGDPVASGIVRSLARPGGNATGVSMQNAELQAKRLQILKEVLPATTRIAVLHNPLNAGELLIVAALKDAAQVFGFALSVLESPSEADLVQAFKSLDAERPDALYVVEGSFSFLHRARIVEFANTRRVPGVYGLSDFADAGGLLSYSADLIEQYRVASSYVDRILKGAKPADLPVQQPMRFEFVVNLKTAREIGVKIPRSVLLRADRIIE